MGASTLSIVSLRYAVISTSSSSVSAMRAYSAMPRTSFKVRLMGLLAGLVGRPDAPADPARPLLGDAGTNGRRRPPQSACDTGAIVVDAAQAREGQGGRATNVHRAETSGNGEQGGVEGGTTANPYHPDPVLPLCPNRPFSQILESIVACRAFRDQVRAISCIAPCRMSAAPL